VTQIASIYRSGFWFFEWNPTDGGQTPAQKFFEDEKGNFQLEYVDGKGNKVAEPEEAALVWKGNTKLEVMTPMNVRWNGSRYAHDADELMVAKMPRLREVYESFPALKSLPLSDIVGHEPPRGDRYLQDLRGEEYRSGAKSLSPDLDLDGTSGEDLEDYDSVLDHPVFLMHYFKKESKKEPNGSHVILVGKTIAFKGERRYGVMPCAQFKLLDEITDPLGLGLVDLLKDPQELLTFVNSMILRHMQMMRRRWFLPQQANVNPRDLTNPDKTTIVYNARAGAKPEAETQPDINQSIFKFQETAEVDFNDMLGIHELSQGKQVPGVQSGRHAEALQAGDATLLGLTRTQLQAGLEHSGLILLNIAKKEWTTERRVRYLGDGRQYVDKAFKRTDFRDTADVRLDKSTLLMLTKAQRTEMLFSFAEVGAILPQELRRLAPLGDTAGVSLTEDAHYQKARREGEKFLAGPTQEQEQAYEQFAQTMQSLNQQSQAIGVAAVSNMAPEEAMAMNDAIMQQSQEAEGMFDSAMANGLGMPNIAEADPRIASIHLEEHAKDRANIKVDSLPTWFVDWWDQNHFAMHLEAIAPPPAQGGPTGDGGLGPDETQQLTDPGALPPASEAGAAEVREG
jgi:hypothetical protein